MPACAVGALGGAVVKSSRYAIVLMLAGCAAFASPSFAQLVAPQTGQHADASGSQAVLTHIQKQLHQAPVVRGSFSQEKTLKGFKQPLRSSGSFVVVQDQGIVWQVLQPFASTLRVTPERLQSLQADGRTGFELQAEQEPGLRAINSMLFALMSGDVQTLVQHFEVQASSSNPAAWLLHLTPRDAVLRQWLTAVHLQGDTLVRRVQLVEAQGEESTIELHNVSLAQVLSAQDAQLFD